MNEKEEKEEKDIKTLDDAKAAYPNERIIIIQQPAPVAPIVIKKGTGWGKIIGCICCLVILFLFWPVILALFIALIGIGILF